MRPADEAVRSYILKRGAGDDDVVVGMKLNHPRALFDATLCIAGLFNNGVHIASLGLHPVGGRSRARPGVAATVMVFYFIR